MKTHVVRVISLITLIIVSSMLGSAATAAVPVKSGEINIVFVGEEPKVLDGQATPFDSGAMFSALLSDRLVGKDRDNNIRPYLATSWSASKDGTVWTFKLRKDVKFHDDTPLNAEAVKFSFDRILDPKTQSAWSVSIIGPIVRTEVVDQYTFRVVHKTPYAPFLDAISQGYVPIWSPTAVNKYGPDGFAQHLVGSGPWMLQQYKPGEQVVYVKNPNYNWAPEYFKHQGPAYLDKVTIRWISDAATAVQVLKAGEANAVIRFPAQNVFDFSKNLNYQVTRASFTGSPVLYIMNTSKPPLNDLSVRKALEYSINQREIVKVLFRGEAIITRGVMYPTTSCYWKGAESMYPFSVDKAKALLDQAGWKPDTTGVRMKDGQKLQITVVNFSDQSLGPIVQAQLKEVGVDAKIEQVPGPIQLQRAINGDFNMIYLHNAASDPSILDIMYNSANLKPGGWSWTRYKDPKLDALLNESTITVDPSKRCQLLTDAQKIIMDQALVLPVYGRLTISVMARSVKDLSFGPRPNVDLWVYDTYIEKK